MGPEADCIISEIAHATELRRRQTCGSRRFAALVGHYSATVEELLLDYAEFGSAMPLFGAPDAFPTASFSKP